MGEIEKNEEESPVQELVEKIKKMCEDEDPDSCIFFAFQGKGVFHIESNMHGDALMRVRSYALRALDGLYEKGD